MLSLAICVVCCLSLSLSQQRTNHCYTTADDAADSITFVFEGAKSEKISDFELKLMDIDGEFLGIPETEYNASISMSRFVFVAFLSFILILMLY